MSPARTTAFYGALAVGITLVRGWGRFWLYGLALAVWIPFSLKYLLRGIARHRKAIGPP
jgi:hypothetical protein